MNKEQFLRALKRELSALPKADLGEIVADYEEYFHDGVASGRTEEEVANGLGDPKKIARELLAQVRIQAWQDNKSMGNLMRVVLAIAALGSLNLFLAIPMLIFMVLLTVSYTCSIALIVTGLVCGVALIPGVSERLNIQSNLIIENDSGNGKAPSSSKILADGQSAPLDVPEPPPPPPPPPDTPEPDRSVASQGKTDAAGRRVEEEFVDGKLAKREIQHADGYHLLEVYEDGDLVSKQLMEANGRQLTETFEDRKLVKKEVAEPNGYHLREIYEDGKLIHKEVQEAGKQATSSDQNASPTRQELALEDGGKATIETDAAGNKRLSAEGADGRKVLIIKQAESNKSSLHIHDKDGDIHISGMDGFDVQQLKLTGFLGGLIVGSLWLWFNIWITKVFFRGFIRYARLNVSIIRGETQDSTPVAN
ncbi:putative membrane protein [Chitinivorax tropicus]|uniref:Putative membrane protein n=1 Tax=Chitinivorax tropicus TaxID=714531 RepID=A0A840MM14_9PROT|nr:DUF1700 domain-containing protein [Chitinivorax tropicus]MBB5019678.1 putative membrane protein [Chitinivorax tropicus]